MKRIARITLVAALALAMILGAGLADENGGYLAKSANDASTVALNGEYQQGLTVFHNSLIDLGDIFTFTGCEGWPDNALVSANNENFFDLTGTFYRIEGDLSITVTLTGVEGQSATVDISTRDRGENFVYLRGGIPQTALYDTTYTASFELWGRRGWDSEEERLTDLSGFNFGVITNCGEAQAVVSGDEVILTYTTPAQGDRDNMQLAIVPLNWSFEGDKEPWYGGAGLFTSEDLPPFNSFDIEAPEGEYGALRSGKEYTLKLYPCMDGERVDVQLDDYDIECWTNGHTPEVYVPTVEVVHGDNGDHVEIKTKFFLTNWGNWWEYSEIGGNVRRISDEKHIMGFWFHPDEIKPIITELSVEADGWRRDESFNDGEPYALPGDWIDFMITSRDIYGKEYRDWRCNNVFHVYQELEGGIWADCTDEWPEQLMNTDEGPHAKLPAGTIRLRAFGFSEDGYIEKFSVPITVIDPTGLTFPLFNDTDYWFEIDDGKIIVNFGGYEDIVNWEVTVTNEDACEASYLRFDGPNHWRFEFDVTPTACAYSFDATFKGSMNGIDYASTITIGTNGISKRADVDSITMESGMRTNAQAMFNISEAQYGLVRAMSSDWDVVESHHCDDIYARQNGEAEIELCSEFDINEHGEYMEGRGPLAKSKIYVDVGEYDDYELGGVPDTIQMLYGEAKTVDITLYGYDKDAPVPVDMTSDKYAAEFVRWEMPHDIPEPELTFVNGKLQFTIPAIDDPDDNWGGNMEGGYFEVRVWLKDKEYIRPLYFDRGVSVFDGGVAPEIASFALDMEYPGCDYSMSYENNEQYSLYFKALDANGNRVDKIPAGYQFIDEHYRIEDEDYNPYDIGEGETPEIKAEIEVVTDVQSQKDWLKVTYSINLTWDFDETEVFIHNYIACYSGDDAPKITGFGIGFNVYVPKGAPGEIVDCDMWVYSDSSRDYVLPVGASFGIDYELIDLNGKGYYNHPNTHFTYQYMNEGEWVDASLSDVKTGTGFPARASNDDFPRRRDLVALREGKFRVLLSYDAGDRTLTGSTGIYEIVPGAESVALKGGADLPILMWSHLAYEDVFNVTPAGAPFMIYERYDNRIRVERHKGAIYADTDDEIDNFITAYAPGKKSAAVTARVWVDNSRRVEAGLRDDHELPSYIVYGETVENIKLPIWWMEEDSSGEQYYDFNGNDVGNAVVLSATNGVTVTEQGVNEDGDLVVSLKAPGAASEYTDSLLVFNATKGSDTVVFDYTINLANEGEAPLFNHMWIDLTRTEMDAVPAPNKPIDLYFRFNRATEARVDLRDYDITVVPILNNVEGTPEVSKIEKIIGTGDIDDMLLVTATFCVNEDDYDHRTGLRIDIKKNNRSVLRWDFWPEPMIRPQGIESIEAWLIDENNVHVTKINIGDEVRLTIEATLNDDSVISDGNVAALRYLAKWDGSKWMDFNGEPEDEGETCALGFLPNRMFAGTSAGFAGVWVRTYDDDGDIVETHTQPIEVIDDPIEAIPGDAYADAELNNRDVIAILRWVKDGKDDYTPKEFIRGDYNGDKMVDNNDAQDLINCIAELANTDD